MLQFQAWILYNQHTLFINQFTQIISAQSKLCGHVQQLSPPLREVEMLQASLLQEIKRIKQTRTAKRASQEDLHMELQKGSSSRGILHQKGMTGEVGQRSEGEEVSETQKEYSWQGYKFYFPMRDAQLSRKRVEVFSDLIKRRGGKVVDLEKAYAEGCDYMISTPEIPKHLLGQYVERSLPKIQKLKYKSILDYRYIIDCEKKSQVLPTLGYELSLKTYESFPQSFQMRKLRHVEQEGTDCECEEQEKITSFAQKSRTSNQSALIKFGKGYLPNEIKKEHFGCQKGSSGAQFSVNQYIYEQLMKLYSIHESEKDTGRKIAYMKAASVIKNFHKQIQSEKDISQLRGVGKKIISKVKQLLMTGRIQKLQKLKQSQEALICQQLMRVWGIGPSKAKELFLTGISSLQMLRSRQELLNKNQRIGLRYVEEFQRRIPRTKVEEILNFVRAKVYETAKSESLHIVEACGSYRRGKQTCGDIDIIITRRDGAYEEGLVVDLVEKLEKQGFLTDHLSIPSKKTSQINQSVSYMGVCVFKQEIHHRIDIKYYPFHKFAFATLYFTGSDLFNRSMRLLARKKGYSLSDHGLVPVERNASNKKIWTGGQIKLYEERQIFQFLELDYKSPHQRNI